MPLLPTLPVQQTYRDVTDTFAGYDHEPKISDGMMYDTQNLTTDYYPLLASRKKRGWVKNLFSPGTIFDKNGLVYIDEGILYINNAPTPINNLSSGEKQIVSMGAYICIFPDKVYYNTADPEDYGQMDGYMKYTGMIYPFICNSLGTDYTSVYRNSAAPASPTSGQLWNDLANHVLKKWNSTSSLWETVSDAYTKIIFYDIHEEIKHKFHVGDEVNLSDFPNASTQNINGSRTIIGMGLTTYDSEQRAYIILTGISDNTGVSVTDGVLSRTVPDMDFVVECKNRLWGCKYGTVDGVNVNEIYASKLGDFRTWNTYQGISTDPYTASVGSDGPWTGAINYMGYPTFFKQDRIHRVAVSSIGAHEITETVCDGVQAGSGKSLAIISGVLYYKTVNGIVVYQGGQSPTLISKVLGELRYGNAVAGVTNNKYYISMQDSSDVWHMFVYDSAKGLWIREDNTKVKQFAAVDDELYMLTGKNEIWTVNGINGTAEENVDWHAESGMLYYSYPDRKYVSRFDIRLEMERGARMRIFIEYNSSGRWEKQGEIIMSGTNSRAIPIRPKRCDHCRIRIEGRGAVKIYSLARILEIGSDY